MTMMRVVVDIASLLPPFYGPWQVDRFGRGRT